MRFSVRAAPPSARPFPDSGAGNPARFDPTSSRIPPPRLTPPAPFSIRDRDRAEGDRKAYFETSQWTIKQNKETIAGLKKEHKLLMAQLSEQNVGGNAPKASETTAGSEELYRLQQFSKELKKKYDDLKQTAIRKTRELEQRLDTVKDLENESDRDKLQEFGRDLKREYEEARKAGRPGGKPQRALNLDEEHLKQSAVRKTKELEQRLGTVRDLENDTSAGSLTRDNPTTRMIRQLENRFDKALIKYNEANSIKKTYEQIVKRLMDERVGFDGQLKTLERALQQKEKDLSELILMSHDANAAKEQAKSELMEVDNFLAKERRKREKDLRDRRKMVTQRKKMNEREEKMRLARDAEEARLAELAQAKAEATAEAKAKAEAKREAEEQGRISSYEDAFLKIKDATGVSDLDQVVQKFMTQEDTNRNLKQLSQDGQARVDALKAEIKSAKNEVERLQFGGPTGPASRRAVDDLEIKLSGGGVVNDRARLKFETVHKLLVGIKAGTEHLSDRLDGIRAEAPPPPMSDETVVEVLATCEQKLLRALDVVAKKGGEEQLGRTLRKSGVLTSAADVSRHNFRLELFPDDEHDGEGGDSDDDDAGAEKEMDLDEERQRIKDAAANGPGSPGKGAGGVAQPPTPSTVRGKAGRGARPGLA